ncbi:MAG: transaldolase [Anaerolineaceae bacterium]|nr:transaldolase [Anaerolineaceae bacterium]NTV36892.1 transaldolase [Anaerolineaceae bacterium]
MQFFLDSAHVKEIAYALDAFNIDGVTTNPRHVQVSGKPFMTVIREIARLVEGTTKTVSVEVNPHFMTYEEMLPEAEKLAAISPNFVIKLQCVEPSFKVIEALAKKDIRVNCTLIFSAMQALQAMRSGAYYISPFIGWKEANGEEVRNFVEDIVTIRDNYDFDSQIIVAAVRNSRQIVDSALVGADIVTAGLAVYQEGILHPYTREGIEKFTQFWDETPYE